MQVVSIQSNHSVLPYYVLSMFPNIEGKKDFADTDPSSVAHLGCFETRSSRSA